MNYRKEFSIKSAKAVNLDNYDPDLQTNKKQKKSALRKIGKLKNQMNELQFNPLR